MKRLKRIYGNFWWAIGKEQDGWEFDLATPHISIMRNCLDFSNDWHMTIHFIFFGFVIGWETMKKGIMRPQDTAIYASLRR